MNKGKRIPMGIPMKKITVLEAENEIEKVEVRIKTTINPFYKNEQYHHDIVSKTFIALTNIFHAHKIKVR